MIYTSRVSYPVSVWTTSSEKCTFISFLVTRVTLLNFLKQAYNRKKNILKNERGCRDIKTKKAQEQDWDGTLATKLTPLPHI